MVKRKFGVENIPDIQEYYNRLLRDEDEDGVKMVLEYQMDMINKLWKSMIGIMLDLDHIRGNYPRTHTIIEPLFNIKGDEEE